ncbi:hypothetical protein RUM44_002498 [Polyplax serrata]|uniref:Uncharacterized protein n=1 Tax=Polyplax serrata TaxID=468196 RepID=A0ABR1AEY9_POLSC
MSPISEGPTRMGRQTAMPGCASQGTFFLFSRSELPRVEEWVWERPGQVTGFSGFLGLSEIYIGNTHNFEKDLELVRSVHWVHLGCHLTVHPSGYVNLRWHPLARDLSVVVLNTCRFLGSEETEE